MSDELMAYEQLKNDPSLVFITGEYDGEGGIWAWQSYTQSRFNRGRDGLILTLCFVPSRVSAIALNFYQCTVPATPDRVALITVEPTRNITGGRAIDSQVGSPEQWERQIEQWIQNPFLD